MIEQPIHFGRSMESVTVYRAGKPVLMATKAHELVRLASECCDGLVRLPKEDGTMQEWVDHAELCHLGSLALAVAAEKL